MRNIKKAFLDLKGCFPYKSSKGNEYILIAYHGDVNAIFVTPVRNRQAQTLKKARLHLHIQFSQSSTTSN